MVYDPAAAARVQQQAAQKRMASINQGPGDQADLKARTTLQQNGYGGTPAEISAYRVQSINNLANSLSKQAGQLQPVKKQTTVAPRSTVTARSGGGGGGGGSAAPVMSQALLDWYSSLLKGGAPAPEAATNVDLPDYAGMAVRAFDPTQFNQTREAWGQGVQGDLATSNQATQDMLGFLNRNYSNAYSNPNYATNGQAPGMDQQAMSRLLSSQGVNPNVASQTQQQGVQADQAFSNLWKTLGAGEDRMQTNRLANAQQYGNQANQSIQAAGRAGQLGIDQAQSGAQAQWQKAADDRSYQDYQMQQQLAQQEAMANWQRQNQVADTNNTTQNSYRNEQLQAILGLLPQLIGQNSLQLPDLASLGLG